MRRYGLIGVYLLGMAVLGFIVVPRAIGLHNRPTAAGEPSILVLARAPIAASPPVTVATMEATAPATATPAATPPVAQESAPVALKPQPSPYGPNRLIIPAIGVNSSWMPLGFLSDGLTMASPPGPSDLGWYTFSGRPGGPSNAVFAGHVDWYTGAPAIFAGLGSLGPGSVVKVSRSDGMLVTYHVVSSTWYDFLHTDASFIIAPTSTPTVTLITCGGVFNQATHEYDKRLVVRAVAID